MNGQQLCETIQFYGADTLAPDTLLAAVIAPAVRGDALTVARRVINEFGDHDALRNLSHASIPQLTAIDGIGPCAAAAVIAASILGRRMLQDDIDASARVRCPSDAAAILIPRLSWLEQESLVVVLLDTKNRICGVREVYTGSVNATQIRTAEIFRYAVREQCPAIIVAHNHPSGDPTPSPEDVRMTRDMIAAGNLLDIEMLDHLVIGRGTWTSIREKFPQQLYAA